MLHLSVSVILSIMLYSFSGASLPEKLVVGYASWSECDEKIVQAAVDGVNVVIWFAINLGVDDSGNPLITGGPNLTCVANIKEELNLRNLSTSHLISVGGWDAPHPDTSNSPETVYANWVAWNDNLFDGFDWDVEGNDDLSSPNNHFTQECLDLMGRMSQLAKRDGYVVSMAPAESYLDPTTSQYDRSLLHNYPEWEILEPDFHYHGRNGYAYLLHRYGTTAVDDGDLEGLSTATFQNTFDFVSIQLYESYSHAVYNVTVDNVSPSDYLQSYISLILEGWSVDFGLAGSNDDKSLSGSQRIRIAQTQLVVGLANGWADGTKTLLIWPEEAGMAYEALKSRGLQPRGFMFWDIADEGMVVAGTDREMWMASGLNTFMHTR